MFYNHFGIERLGELEDSIIPVNWGYGTRPGEHVVDGHYVHHDELCAQGRPVWGLAGYNSVCRFLPDAAAGRDNIYVWARTARETDTPALVAAQWGDNGYENHRDLPWNLFAYLGEAAWSGEDARPEDFERRFQRHFYGVELPPLQEVLYDLPQQLSAGLSEYWRRFRRGAPWSIRWAEQNPDAAQGLSSDEERLSAALLRVEDCRAVAQRNAEHLDHFTVALERMLSVVRRQKVGVAYVGGLNLAETVQSVQQVKRHLSDVREHYIADWIRTNKPPNMEVSLQVYDRVLDSYDFLLEYEPSEQVSRGGFLPLLLEGLFNRNEPAVADAPLGLRRCNGVPFNFADRHHTHVALVQGDASLSVEFEECAVEDLHLLVAGERRTDEPAPALRVELLRGGEVVFREDLMTIVHLCDWWAPRGEHIWAGGGMAHVNRDRVRYALDVGNMHGVAEVYNFALDGGAEADALRLTALGESEVALFAATLEGCPGRGGAAWSE
jgi:hypothetical protein